MGLDTDIQWCDSTVNPTENCDGCELWNPKKGIKICYAGGITERRRGRGAFDEPIRLFPGRMAQAARWSDLRGQARPGKPWIPPELPRLIFISDMSDALSGAVKFQFLLEEIIQTVSTAPGNRHIWIWLTKRPARMAKFSSWLKWGWPSNLWVLTSVTDERTAKARIPFILQVGDEQTVRGISVEPLLETVLPQYYFCTQCGMINNFGGANLTQPNPACMLCARERSCRYALDWVIVGGQSGSVAPLGTPEKINFLAQHVVMARAACFVKQLGKAPDRFRDPKGGDWNEWPATLRIRQFPMPKHPRKRGTKIPLPLATLG